MDSSLMDGNLVRENKMIHLKIGMPVQLIIEYDTNTGDNLWSLGESNQLSLIFHSVIYTGKTWTVDTSDFLYFIFHKSAGCVKL